MLRLVIPIFLALTVSACNGSTRVVETAEEATDIALADGDDINPPSNATLDTDQSNDNNATNDNAPPSNALESQADQQQDQQNPQQEQTEPEFTAEPEATPEPFELGTFELRLDATRFELIEANENGITVPINISRLDNHIRTVRITVSPETGQDAQRLDTRMERAELSGDETFTSWRAELGVAVAPIQFHERRFIVTADDGRTQSSMTFSVDVRPISAPDVYLLIGQSNMEGSSELGARDTSPGGLDELNPRIRQLNVRQNNRDLFSEARLFSDAGFNVMEPRYITAEDPLHEPRFSFRENKEGSFIGLGLSFAKAALPNTSTDIILVPAAWSARGFCGNDDPDLAWNAVETDEQALGGTLLADRAITRLNTALQDTGGILRGILWHQGEADSNNRVCSERYENNVVSLANRIKREAFEDARGQGARGDNATVPFILGTMSRGNDERGSFSPFSDTKQRVDNAHRNLPNILPASDIATADDLIPPDYPCGQSSCIHFGATAYRELGVRYYQALQRVIERNP